MKSFGKLKYLAMLMIMIPAIACADYYPVDYVIPDSISIIDSAEGLRPYIISENEEDRILAVLRLGAIRTDESFSLLKEAFKNEPYRPWVDVPPGVKYYALVSIGKIALPNSEEYLKNIIQIYSENIHSAGDCKDSLVAIKGAINGLYELNSSGAYSFLNDIINDPNPYWAVRLYACLALKKYNLRNNAFKTARDTSDYLIEGFASTATHRKMWLPDGTLDFDFVLRSCYSFLLFEYGVTVYPYLEEYISNMDNNDPAKEEMEKLRDDIRNNRLR